jgi:AAA15 family ATPase/GTPase
MNKDGNVYPSSHSKPNEWIVIKFYIKGSTPKAVRQILFYFELVHMAQTSISFPTVQNMKH